LPPPPPLIPACNATNYHEFNCTVATETESWASLASKLHVNPTKLCEYNFRYECDADVTPGLSIRVPYVTSVRRSRGCGSVTRSRLATRF
jgi:hypothetical protein